MSNQIGSSGVLNAHTRADALAAMQAEELDVLIIGGGIVGAGCALDAASRGLSTGVLEAQDWASGTSSRSSKLVHGGIRYLEQLDFHLVEEALTERGLLLQNIAPHLVKPIRFLYPVHHRFWERAYIGAGMLLYDALSYMGGRRPGVRHHRHLSARQIEMAAPSLSKSNIIGGLSYYDGRVDDARYVVNLVRTAVSQGAHAANRVAVTGFLQKKGAVVGVKARDLETGAEFEVRAKQVINATGVWTAQTQAMVKDGGTLKVRASKGIHIVVPKSKFRSTMGLLLRTEKSVLFVIPWGRHWIIGTTDTDWDLDKARPSATAEDINYLLEHINAVVDEPITHEDIEGVYVGLRPLVAGDAASTTKLSREHVVVTPQPGLVLIAGGKWTTYRVMANDAVDAAVNGLRARSPQGENDSAIAESVTEHLPLLGAPGYKAAWNKRARTAAQAEIPVSVVEHLLNRYGSMAEDLLEIIAENPLMAKSLPGNPDYLAAEVHYAVTHEGALHVEDVLSRRTRLDIETKDRGVEAAPVVAKIMGEVLGWDTTQIRDEARNYRLAIEAELAAETQDTDQKANALRIKAPSVTEIAFQ